MKIGNFVVNPDRLFIRTSDNGFKRKPVGQWNDAGDMWTEILNHHSCDNSKMPRNILQGVPTLELCEWRGKWAVIYSNYGPKICASSYRVIAINEKIPRKVLGKSGIKVCSGVGKITDGYAIALSDSAKCVEANDDND